MASSDADLSKLSAAELVARLSDKPGDLEAVARVLSAREAQHRALQAEICALRKDSARVQEELQDLLTAALSDIHEELDKGAFKLDALLAGRYFGWEGTVLAETYAEHKERLGKIAADVRAKVMRVEDQQQQDQGEFEEIAPDPAAAAIPPVQLTVIEEELQEHLTAAISDIQEAHEEAAFKLEGFLGWRHARWKEAAASQIHAAHKERLGKIAAEIRAMVSASFSKVRVQDQQQDQGEFEDIAPVLPASIPVQLTAIQGEGDQDEAAQQEQQRRQQIMRDEALDIMQELDREFGRRLRPYHAQMQQVLIQELNTPPPPVPSTDDLWLWLSEQLSLVQQSTVINEEGHLGTVSEHEQLIRDLDSFFQARLRRQIDQIVSRCTNGTRSADEASRGTS